MKKIAEFIKKYNNFAIFAHINTDCDAVCSCLATKLALEQLGKSADIFIDSALSHNMADFSCIETINKKSLPKYDAYICLDNATIDRLGKNKYKVMKNRSKSCCIDHHGTNERYCGLNFVDETYSSTCEILVDFFDLLGVEINKKIAKLLISGIYTDTGRLTFSNTTENTLSKVSRLIKIYGDTMDTICEPIFKNKSMKEFALEKVVYDKLEIIDKQIGIVIIDKDDFEKTSTDIEDTHGLVDIATEISKVKISILASQDTKQEDCFYISIRSKNGYSARNVAAEFGGGGHIQASGCKIFDSKENIRKRLIDAARKEVKC